MKITNLNYISLPDTFTIYHITLSLMDSILLMMSNTSNEEILSPGVSANIFGRRSRV
jgi:hypothetical protein